MIITLSESEKYYVKLGYKLVIPLRSEISREFEKCGYVILRGVLDPTDDLQPVASEYSKLLNSLSKKWFSEGKLSSEYSDLSFDKRISAVASEMGGEFYQPFDISLPQKNITNDTPMHLGPAVFNLLRNQKLLDAVESFIGPEIYCNPVQHVRIKPSEKWLDNSEISNPSIARTYWHQDQVVITEEADESEILTVWFPMVDATVENGCLQVVPGSHKNGLDMHCFTKTSKGIPDDFVGDVRVPLPMKVGDVLFMNKLTRHGSLPNLSEDIRWSFDLRYNPIGQPIGRKYFPGFVARSRQNRNSELHDRSIWEKKWHESRSALSIGQLPNFNRWDPNDPVCA